MSVNKAILLGHLGADPELKTLEGGSKMVVVSLATNDYYRSADGQRQSGTVWHRLIFWDRQAELLHLYARKGSKLYVEGRIDNRSYQDRDNQTHYISEIVVSSFEMLDGPPRQSAGRGGGTPSADAKDDASGQGSGNRFSPGGDDLPFVSKG